MRLKWIIFPFFTIITVTSSKMIIDLKINEEGKCPEITECPFNVESCFDDNDCNPASICCNSPCGKVCTKLLYTGCEIVRQAVSRQAKALGVDNISIRMPRCSKDGRFEPIQCNNEIVSSCWCVDETGFELPGTRAPAAALVNCTEPKSCAAHTCRMFCPHGFALTQDGCPQCKCRDPCEDIKCPDSLACHLENLACIDPPCPPVPTCKRGRSLDNICPLGNPLRISDTIRPFLCGNEPSKPSCPPLYQCIVQKGNEYGVCCPASLKIQKTGSCPAFDKDISDCGSLCTHDLECQSVQKCCETEQCGLSCTYPKNVTDCLHQKTLSELLVINEREGRGYIPQCSDDGQFKPKQCSRNNLVCWCVDKKGRKLKGSMGPAETVNCSLTTARNQFLGRSISNNAVQCKILECAAICEYGFKFDELGCPTCKCDEPCEGYTCHRSEECVTVKDSTCVGAFCATVPVCRPKGVYTNPCQEGTPLIDDKNGIPIICTLQLEDKQVCPGSYNCTPISGSDQAVCCPAVVKINQDIPQNDFEEDLMKINTMCTYLQSFSERMEGTRDGMVIALSPPTCDSEGSFLPTQCDKDWFWCVDQFGTEIPNTRGYGNATKDCKLLRISSDCLDLTCRMGCDYGFVLEEGTGCPTCQCRDPCTTITCQKNQQCQLVEVNCKDHYCAPVPVCLPKKVGQCPYIVPATSISCDFECNSDMACNGTMRCCSNGCGTYCTEPLLLTACQHQRLLAEHNAHESGKPANRIYMPNCKSDGTFENKQCDPGNRECWCVDFRGFEISQTRVTSNKLLDCEKPLEPLCPMHKCVRDCEYGFELDAHGCRTCKCVDPCSKLSCREDGEVCRLVNVECINQPCPSVPMCLPKKENPCQNGEPLKLGTTEEIISCGPEFESCPSSHKCQLSPLGEYAVCCPKPRDVCFESLEKGQCKDEESQANVTRHYFNSKSNKCEPFLYSGCDGNHNNFETEQLCNIVCPVLSQCERLREKNLKQSEKYNKPMFMPRCEPTSGKWEAVQCLDVVHVCWCVNPHGEPIKGTLTRKSKPECNFRQARNRARNRADILDDTDIVLDELMMQIGDFDEHESQEMEENNIIEWELPLKTRCEAVGGACDSNGQFLPSQCNQEMCWCVDEAGNQLPNTSAFERGEQLCLPTPITSVDIILGFRGEYDDVTAVPIVNQITRIIRNLRGTVTDVGLFTEITNDMLYVKFSLIGSNKIDVAYRLEQMITHQRLIGVTADITRSRFIHKMETAEPLIAERIVALEHREIVSQSPVSFIAHYYTAMIVIVAASAFVISVLTLLVILYRKKIANANNISNKVVEDNQKFLSLNRPIYIELPNDKENKSADVPKST